MKIVPGSIVVVTGASRGIGKATALAFAQKGAHVVLAARDFEKLQEVAKEIANVGGQSLIVPTDVSQKKDCFSLAQKTLEKFGRVDVIINNAGYGHYSSIENLETETLEKIFRTNLFGAFWCTQAFLPHLKKQKKGHVVFVSTIVSERSMPYMSAYCMTKFAVNALEEGFRLEAKPLGIGVSLVCPGLTSTDFQTNSGKMGFAPPIQSIGGMAPQKVAQAILRAVEKNKKRTYLTCSGKTLVYLQRLSPSLVDFILHIFFSFQRKKKNS